MVNNAFLELRIETSIASVELEVLLAFGFSQSKPDYSLFTRGTCIEFVVIVLYVDDIVIAGPRQYVIPEVKSYLQNKFKVKDLRDLKYFLGLESSI